MIRTSDADRRCWQRKGLRALTMLVELGERERLPVLVWRLPVVGSVIGTVDTLAHDDPREAFEAWYAALSLHLQVTPKPLGMRDDGACRRERVDCYGMTRMVAGFTLQLTDREYPSVDVALVAEFDESPEPPADEEGAR